MPRRRRSQRGPSARPRRVHQALPDAEAVEQWTVPDGVTSHTHEFDDREAGGFSPTDRGLGWMPTAKLAKLVENP